MTNTLGYGRAKTSPAFSLPSIIAIVAILISFFTEGADLILGIVAILFGVIGVIISLSPAKRGGIISIVAIIVGVLAILLSIIQFATGAGGNNTVNNTTVVTPR